MSESKHSVVSDEEWIQARKVLLEKEKFHMHATAALAKERASLPWRRITKTYEFIAAGSLEPVPFSSLFTHGPNLVVQHQMFDPNREKACSMCCAWTENYSNLLPFLHTHTAFAVVAAAPPQKLADFRDMKRWQHVPYYSCGVNSEFGRDFGVQFSEEEVGEKLYNYGKGVVLLTELMGISVFRKDGQNIYHTYSTYSAGLSDLHAALKLFDLLPEGRNERASLDWVKHKEDLPP